MEAQPYLVNCNLSGARISWPDGYHPPMARKIHAQLPHDDLLLIRTERLRAGLTLDQLAEMIETSRQHLQRMETGNRNVSLDWLNKIAKALNVPIARLIRGGDGLTDDEREMIEYLRNNPRDKRVIDNTLSGLRETGA